MKSTSKNLNNSLIPTDQNYGYIGEKLANYSMVREDMCVYFRDLSSNLIKHIDEADFVVGCVAWLTHTSILNSMSKLQGVSIIVQKEDFLGPDLDSKGDWGSQLRDLYSKLPGTLNRLDDGFKRTSLRPMSTFSDTTIDAVRCVGVYNSERKTATPRAHHKFLVFCRREGSPDEEGGWNDFSPYEVWTGSFNLTQNADYSFENAVVLRDTEVVQAYFQEYAQIAALSEQLNWEAEWVEPEWRIGT